jgi:ACS family tartrate transporter-like MFS transporter
LAQAKFISLSVPFDSIPIKPSDLSNGVINIAALDRARKKAYRRLLPLLFVCFVIAYVDRVNVSIAKLTMTKAMPAFTDAVIGLGAGIFFIGYFLLEIPGSVLVERWSARKWICRIMVTWGIMAAVTALVKTPMQFYGVRFLLGLAEAGFFPGVVVYLTHWFPARDRTRALACFFIGPPIAQLLSPRISNALLPIGTDEIINGVIVHHPTVLGLAGWQWIYIMWGTPAVVLGILVFFWLTDRPGQASWLTTEERNALEQQLALEKENHAANKKMTLLEGLLHPKVLILAAAYFFNVTANYGLEIFLPSILEQWYNLKLNAITWLVMLPPLIAIAGQLFVGWNSDRMQERRFHSMIPLLVAATAVGLAPFTQGNLVLTIACFMIAFGGLKGCLPAFWALPSLFLTQTAAAGSIGFINSVGNLGGFFGPSLLGWLKTHTGSFVGGLLCLSVSIATSGAILYVLGLGKRERPV